MKIKAFHRRRTIFISSFLLLLLSTLAIIYIVYLKPVNLQSISKRQIKTVVIFSYYIQESELTDQEVSALINLLNTSDKNVEKVQMTHSKGFTAYICIVLKSGRVLYLTPAGDNVFLLEEKNNFSIVTQPEFSGFFQGLQKKYTTNQ